MQSLPMKTPPLGSSIKALSEDKSAVIVAVEARALVAELGRRLQSYPTALRHLGQGLLGVTLLQAMSDSEDDEKLELQWSVAGPFGHLYADSLGSGRLRGTLQNPQAEVLDFTIGLGAGLLQVRRTKPGGVTTTGLVEAEGSVAEDIVRYLRDSEQRSCGIRLNVKIERDLELEASGDAFPFKVTQAAGYLVHVLPQDDAAKKEACLQLWHQRMSVMGPLSEWAIPDDSEAALHFMIHLLTVGSKPQYFRPVPLQIYCTCSEERAKRALALLSPREREDLSGGAKELAPTKTIDLKCEYCGQTYLIAVDAG
ncbi:MAG: Hsp33 family molecular chaperone HslO [Bdellovibrionota bacterium]